MMSPASELTSFLWREKIMSDNKLLHRLDFDKAHYNDRSGGIFIPFNLALGELNLATYLYISCNEEWYKSILFALKEEIEKDG